MGFVGLIICSMVWGQGIELSNPQAHAASLGSGTQSTYFSETGTFSKIKRI
jgi:U4/U6 small nuclear ribonucleoprotein PRP31